MYGVACWRLNPMVGTESAEEAGFTSQRIAEDQSVVAASATHPIFRGRRALRDLKDHRCVLQVPCCADARLARSCFHSKATFQTPGAGRARDAADAARLDR